MLNPSLKLFSRVLIVPVVLAKKIGVEQACLLASCIRAHGTDPFDIISDIYSKESVAYLMEKEFLVRKDDHLFVNYERLNKELGEGSSLDGPYPFKDMQFISLFDKWRKLLKELKRPKSFTELVKLFDGKKLEESIQALQLAVDNRYVSLRFTFDKKPSETTGGGRRTWGSGGSKNTERETSDKLVRRPE